MGLLIAEVPIVTLLMNYDFEAVSKMELEFDFRTIGLLPKPWQCQIKIKTKRDFS